MSASDADTKDVLASLPRSRRQRPTARREAARAKRTSAAAVATGGSAARASAKPRAAAKPASAAKPRSSATTKSAAKPRAAAKAAPRAAASAKQPLRPSSKRASDLPRVRPPRSAIPPAGYATPVTSRGERGSADPGAAIGRLAGAGASVLRSVLSRLPG